MVIINFINMFLHIIKLVFILRLHIKQQRHGHSLSTLIILTSDAVPKSACLWAGDRELSLLQVVVYRACIHAVQLLIYSSSLFGWVVVNVD